MVLMTIAAGLVHAAKIDESDFYKGNYAPDGGYILSGGLIKDLPPPIKVPVHYEAPGFDGSKLSKVPAPGVHPRIIISPSDIERFRQRPGHDLRQQAHGGGRIPPLRPGAEPCRDRGHLRRGEVDASSERSRDGLRACNREAGPLFLG